MIWLLLLSSLSFAQSSTDTEKGTTFTQDIQLTNARKDIAELRNGRPVIPGIPRFIKGICFNQAGTDCQTSAAVATAVASTATTVSRTSTAGTAFAICIATIVFTNVGSTVAVRYSGFAGAGGITNCIAGYLLDGAFADGQSSSLAMMSVTVPANTYMVNMGWESRLTTVAAGSHKYCLWIAHGSSTCDFGGNSVSQQGIQKFSATEVH